jgi:iron complex outermembrane receptor protein
VKDQQAFGLVLNTGLIDAMMHHGGGEGLSGTLGVSGMYQSSTSSGPIFIVPSATIGSVSAFALEQFKTGPVAFLAGGRIDSRNLSSDAHRKSAARPTLAAGRRKRVVGRPHHAATRRSPAATGWRPPALCDLSTCPTLAIARFEIGAPMTTTEGSTSVAGGLRWASDRTRAEVSVFRSDIDDFIFTTPTSTTQNSLRVFRHTQADARLTGAEFSLEARVTDPVVLRASHDFVNGDDLSAGVPLPRCRRNARFLAPRWICLASAQFEASDSVGTSRSTRNRRLSTRSTSRAAGRRCSISTRRSNTTSAGRRAASICSCETRSTPPIATS